MINLLETSLCAGITGVVVLVLRALLRGRLPRRSLAALWALVVLRFLLPGPLPFPTSVYALFPSLDTARGSSVAVIADVAGAAALEQAVGTVHETGTSAQAVSGDGPHVTLQSILWGAGCALSASLFLVLYARQRRFLCTAIRLRGDPAVEELLGGYSRFVRVFTCESISTPLTCGVLRPKILLPSAMNRSDRVLLEHTLTHECMHIRGGDNLLKLLSLCAVCVHWYNPVAWAAALFLSRDLEGSCDERVLRRLGAARRADYARSLLRMAERGASARCPLATGFGRSAVEERLRSIMAFSEPRRWAQMGAMALVAAVFLLFATTPSITWGWLVAVDAAGASSRPAEEGQIITITMPDGPVNDLPEEAFGTYDIQVKSGHEEAASQWFVFSESEAASTNVMQGTGDRAWSVAEEAAVQAEEAY